MSIKKYPRNSSNFLDIYKKVSKKFTFWTRANYTTITISKPPTLVFSGIQPTGIPHIGNYLGAISNWVSLQESPKATAKNPTITTTNDNNDTITNPQQTMYSIVDLHALTLPQVPKQLRKNKIEMTIALLACGIDPKKCILFEQSRVTAHVELAWIFNCITSVGWLSRMTQWKSKMESNKNFQSINEDVVFSPGLCLGLFSYPVLQAADILIYKATHVPIGEDQVQHLELTRDIAQKFNKMYKTNILPLPQPIISK
nr:8305_t:CDS:2 [Entrophospora candida]